MKVLTHYIAKEPFFNIFKKGEKIDRDNILFKQYIKDKNLTSFFEEHYIDVKTTDYFNNPIEEQKIYKVFIHDNFTRTTILKKLSAFINKTHVTYTGTAILDFCAKYESKYEKFDIVNIDDLNTYFDTIFQCNISPFKFCKYDEQFVFIKDNFEVRVATALAFAITLEKNENYLLYGKLFTKESFINGSGFQYLIDNLPCISNIDIITKVPIEINSKIKSEVEMFMKKHKIID